MMRMASGSRTTWTTKSEVPVLGESNGGFPRFAVAAGMCQAHERVEEHFTGLFEAQVVFAQVRYGLRGVPFKGLAVENVTHVHHRQRIYVVD